MYCMNCGVRLGEGESRCPLCGLRAYHPELPKQSGDSLYPKQWVAPEPERTSMRFLLTVVGLVAGVVCLLVDLGLWGRVTWSGYVLGGLAVAYALFALPVTGIACVLTTAVVALTHYLRRGYFFIFGGASIAVGCSAMLVELFQCITFGGQMFRWSLYPVGVLSALGLFWILAGIIRPLGDAIRKRVFI